MPTKAVDPERDAAMAPSESLAALKIDRGRKRRRVSPWLWSSFIAIGFLVVMASGLLRGGRVAEVAVTSVTRVSSSGEPIEGSAALSAAGYVVADRQSVLAAKFTGRLAKLNVAEAEAVKAGQVVAEIDHAELDAMIAQAEAEVAEAEAEVARLGQLAMHAEAQRSAASAPLATIDAENKQYKILLTDARRRLERDERLAARNAISDNEVEDRRTEVLSMEAKIAWTDQRKREAEQAILVAEAQLAAARAAVTAAEARQRSTVAKVGVLERQREESFIRSPFDGIVTEKAAEVGEIIAPISIGGSMARGSIVTVADWNSLQAEVDVAEAQLARVQPGQRAAIRVDAIPGKMFPGKVRRILPRADRSKATVKVRVDFTERHDQAVLPEMGVRVQFLAKDAPAGAESGKDGDRIAVPKEAVHADGDGRFAWVVREEVAHRRAVKVGADLGKRVEIRSGLSAGDQVVIRGADALAGESAPVRLVE